MKRVHRGRPQRKRTAKNWIPQRNACFERAGGVCEVSGERLYTVHHGEDCDGANCENFDEGYCTYTWRRVAHHVIAERFVRKLFKGVDPHELENLVAITPSLHSKITAAENRLFKADWLGYRRELNRLGFPLEILDRAFRFLCALEKTQ